MEKELTVKDLKIMICEVNLHPCLQYVFPNGFWNLINWVIDDDDVSDDMNAEQLIELFSLSDQKKMAFEDLRYVTTVLIAKAAADTFLD